MAPGDRVTPPHTPAIAYLQEHRAEGRFVGLELAFPPEVSIRFGLADVRGYNPPFPTKASSRSGARPRPTRSRGMPTTIEGMSPPAVQVTGALGARFILAGPGTTPPTEADPALRALRRVYSGREATIFENPRAAPRAFVAPAIVPAPDAAHGARALAESGFNASRTVVVEGDQPGAAGSPAPRAPAARPRSSKSATPASRWRDARPPRDRRARRPAAGRLERARRRPRRHTGPRQCRPARGRRRRRAPRDRVELPRARPARRRRD